MKAKIYTGESRTGKTRVAQMVSEHVGVDKTFWLSARGLSRDKSSNIPFLLAGISDNTELLIIDDCPIDFDYSYFFPVEDKSPRNADGSGLKFRLTVEESQKKRRDILIPQIIFTTVKLDPKWKESGASFNARFDIIEFPLSGVDKCSNKSTKTTIKMKPIEDFKNSLYRELVSDGLPSNSDNEKWVKDIMQKSIEFAQGRIPLDKEDTLIASKDFTQIYNNNKGSAFVFWKDGSFFRCRSIMSSDSQTGFPKYIEGKISENASELHDYLLEWLKSISLN